MEIKIEKPDDESDDDDYYIIYDDTDDEVGRSTWLGFSIFFQTL